VGGEIRPNPVNQFYFCLSGSDKTVNRSTQTLLDRLDDVRSSGKDRWLARCPAHKDGSPSLSICDKGDRVLAHCFAGCDIADVMTAVNLSMTDLFEDKPAERKGSSRPYLTSREIVAVIEEDTWFLIVAAQAMLENKFNAADQDRLHQVVPRLFRVLENTK
jgi:hypothetical protein